MPCFLQNENMNPPKVDCILGPYEHVGSTLVALQPSVPEIPNLTLTLNPLESNAHNANLNPNPNPNPEENIPPHDSD